MDISSITKLLKLPKKTFFLGCIITAVLLFSGDDFIIKLSLQEFKANYTLWIGVAFLISLGMSFIFLFEHISFLIKEHKIKKQEEIKKKQDLEINQEKEKKERDEEENNKQDEFRKYQNILKNLDDFEKAILREFVISRKNTTELSFEDPTVLGLIKKKVVRQVGNWVYHTDITGGISFFLIDERSLEFFGDFDFDEISNTPRPKWIEGMKTQEAINNQTAKLGRMIQRL